MNEVCEWYLVSSKSRAFSVELRWWSSMAEVKLSEGSGGETGEQDTQDVLWLHSVRDGSNHGGMGPIGL